MNKIPCILFALFCCLVTAKADGRKHIIAFPYADTAFVSLPAENYPVSKEGLPFYTTAQKVGAVSASSQFSVSIEYPEYRALNGEETKWAKLHQQQIHESISIGKNLGFSRKQGILDISFCPIIRKENKFYRLISCKIKVENSSAPTRRLNTRQLSTPTRWKSSSILKSGNWAKIRVKKEGIYQLTPSFLKKMGFKDPDKIKVYGYGGRILEENWTFDDESQVIDDLEEIPLYRKKDGNALFFAEGTVRWTYNDKAERWIHENNPYSKYSYYFITEGENPSLLTKEEATSSAQTVTVVKQIPYYAVYDNDAFGWYSGGREMYDDYDFAFGPQHTFKLKTPSVATQEGDNRGNAEISFTAASTSSATTVNINFGEKFLGNLSIPKFANFQSAYEVRKNFNIKQINEENSFTFKVSPSNPARLNFIRVNYNRMLKATDNPYSFSPNIKKPVDLKITDATATTRLWRIGYHGHPNCEIASSLEGNVLSAKIDDGTQRFVFLDVEGDYPTPEWDEKVENQNLHGDSAAYDMVILIPESRKLAKEAERLAEIHQQQQGLRVKVVDAGQIYNEFSSGTPDATAYRRYMKMLYDRAKSEEDMPRYLLLFGDCAWDNRMISSEFKNQSPKDYLLSFEVTDGFNNPSNTVFALGEQNSFVTDDYFGWLDDNEGDKYTTNKLDLGIGRFPCTDAATAKIFVDKCIDYMSNKKTGAWKNTIYVLADNGNGNLHMNDAEMVVKQIESSTKESSVIKKVYIDAYTRISTGTGHSFPTATRILQDAMQQGALIFNYTGHGNPDQLSHSKILRTEDFERPSSGNLPLWVMASCEISPYDSKKHDMGRAALENPSGGAIAVMCASRAVYSNYNRILNIAYNKYLFENDNKNGKRNTMGDAMRLTKVDLVTPSGYGGIKDASINKLKYVLLGNPALALASPTGQVTIDSINGEVIGANEPLQLKAGSLVRFSGRIRNADGIKKPDFNGSITATMSDRLETITCKNNDNTADMPMVYKDRTKTIFEGSDSVRNGVFQISLRIPRDISYTNDRGRITFYAVNNEKSLECHGANDNFYLNGTDTSYAPDTLAPKMFVYLNHPDFPDGGVVAPNPVFFAKITDDAGINSTGIGIGHDMELVIDNDFSNPVSLNSHFNYVFGSYNEGLAQYPLLDLSMGKHTLSFRAWDVNGNSTTKELKFFIQDGIEQGFDVYATENPARTQTNFVTTFNTTEDEGEHNAVFEVYSLNGQKVWKSESITLAPGRQSALTTWRLNLGNGARVPAGIYLYKVILHGNQGKQESKAKKIIVLEQ